MGYSNKSVIEAIKRLNQKCSENITVDLIRHYKSKLYNNEHNNKLLMRHIKKYIEINKLLEQCLEEIKESHLRTNTASNLSEQFSDVNFDTYHKLISQVRYKFTNDYKQEHKHRNLRKNSVEISNVFEIELCNELWIKEREYIKAMIDFKIYLSSINKLAEVQSTHSNITIIQSGAINQQTIGSGNTITNS